MSEPSAKTLLVVDDDPSILQLVELLLEPLVARFWSSPDPDEGLKLAIMHQPSLILLDNHMGPVLGVEVLEKLRKIPATAAIPVIMMTADNSIETVRRAAGQQVQGYLLKPCDPDLLLDKLAPWLDLPRERPQRELTAPLQLSAEAENRLELGGLLLPLELLGHELHLLTLAARDGKALEAPLQQLRRMRDELAQPPPRLDLLGGFAAFGHTLFAQLEGFWRQYPELIPRQRGVSEANLRALLALLQERVTEFTARIGDPLGWQRLPLETIRRALLYPLEAAGRNTLSRYAVDYARPETVAEAHIVACDLPAGDSLRLPLALLDVLRGLSARAYAQTPPGGELGLRLRTGEGLLKLTVSDTGAGLSADQLKALADKPPTDAALLNACRITRLLGGRIWLAAQAGAGTDVLIEIPLPA